MELSIIQTLFLLIFFLLIGYGLQKRVELFSKYYVPAPMIGGFLFSLFLILINKFYSINPDFSPLPVFVAAFFVSIGLRVDKDFFRKGFKWQILFLTIVTGVAILQNIVALVIGKAIGKPPMEIVISGSLGLMADHTLLSAIPVFSSRGNAYIQDLVSFSILSLFVGSLAGGILFKKLKEKTDLSSNIKIPNPTFAPIEFLEYLFLFVLAITLGILPSQLGFGKYINPAGGGFLVGLVLRLLLDKTKVFEVKAPQVNLLGNYALSMLLITVFSMFDIRSILNVSSYHIIMLILQLGWLMALSYWVVYRLYRQNALASYVATGLIGFSVGMPASTMSTLQCLAEREGAIPMVLFIVPPVGAWMINVINTYILNLIL